MTNGSIGLQDRAEIEWLLSEVIGRRDRDEGDTMAELFTEDAHIVTPRIWTSTADRKSIIFFPITNVRQKYAAASMEQPDTNVA